MHLKLTVTTKRAEAVLAVVVPTLVERPHNGEGRTSALGSGWACVETPALPPFHCSDWISVNLGFAVFVGRAGARGREEDIQVSLKGK